VEATFPKAKIDLFVKGWAAPTIFKNYESINAIYSLPKKPFRNLFKYSTAWIRMIKGNYDLVINAVSDSSSGRLAAKLIDAPLKISGEPESETSLNTTQSRHIALRPVFSFREFVSKLDLQTSARAVPYLDLRLSPVEIANGKTILEKLTGNGTPTIALYTFATGAKCYSPEWWDLFLKDLEAAFSGYNIIEILPVENVSQLSFRLPSFYSKDIREIASVIANTAVFIGADSGIMHLASAAGAPTIGLFAVTDPESYRPYNPGSLAIDTRSGSLREWVTTIRNVMTQEEIRPE
jgi:ADP-heptose:LPS heptosyltransferase